MTTDQSTPTIGVLVFLYVCGLVVVVMFGPGIVASFSSELTQGEVVGISGKEIKFTYSDRELGEVEASVSRENGDEVGVDIGDYLEVRYVPGKIVETRVPAVQGKDMWPIFAILIAFSAYAIGSYHVKYLRYVNSNGV